MWRVIVGTVLIAVLAWLAWRWTASPIALQPVAPVDTLAAGYKAARLFFAAPSGDSLVDETREMVETPNVHDRVKALVAELDRGPTGRGVAALPPGTSVIHAYLDDRGLLVLDLSRAFQTGFRGGSSAEYLAVSSLIRTIGANVDEVRRVQLICGGAPLATLAGHLSLDRPIEMSELP